MPLQRQVVSIPMSGALDTKTDPNQLPIGKLLELENGFRKRNGELVKRYGYETLGTTLAGDGNIADGRRMAIFDNELNVLTNKNFYTYSDDNDNWVLKGPLETLSVSSQPIVANSYAQTTADSCTSGSIALFVWEDSRAAGSLRYQILDRSSNSVIVGDSLLDADGAKPHCIALDGKLFVFYRVSTGNVCRCKIFDAVNPASIATLTVGSDFNATGNMDVIELNGALIFAYHTTGNQIKLGYITRTGAIGGAANGYPPIATLNYNPELCITLFTSSTLHFNIAWANTTAGVAHIGLYPDLTTARIPYGVIDAYVGGATTRVRNITGFETSVNVQIYWDKDDTVNKWKRSITDTHRLVAAPYTVSPGNGNLKSVSLAGKIFYTDDNGFVPVAFYSDTQPTLFLLRNDGDVCAKMISQAAGGETAKTGHLPNVVNTSNGYWRFSTTYKSRIQSENNILFSLTGITEVIFNFNDEFVGDSAQLGDNLHITGGYLYAYDGVSLFESGFHLYPDPITLAQGAAGVLNGTYQYVVVYEWTDSRNQIHRSAPSVAQTITVPAAKSVDITIPTLHITDRKGSRPAVVLAVYRTEASGTIFYKCSSVTSPTYNDTSVVSVTINDNLADATLRTREILYTTGNVVPNSAPPAGTIIARFKNRMFIAGLEDTNSMWYSKEHSPGEAINFSAFFKIQVDDTGGKITALGELDDKLIIFKSNTIFALIGDGPLPTGAQNTFSVPQLISSDVGCVDPYSVVRTRNGLMFKSKKGIYQLDRGLQISYIGSEVEQWNDLTITSATVVDEQNQVRFTTAEGRCLVYDIYFDQWYTFTNIKAIDSTTWQGKWLFLKSSAEIWRETKDSYRDIDIPIISKYTLALMQFGQIQGFQRIFKINILGDNRGTHGLKIQLGYDYREFYEEQFIINPDDVLYSSTWGSDTVWGQAGTLWGGNVDGVYQFQVRPRQQRCQALKISIEDFYGSGSGTAGFALSNITAEVGVEPNIARIAKSKIIAP